MVAASAVAGWAVAARAATDWAMAVAGWATCAGRDSPCAGRDSPGTCGHQVTEDRGPRSQEPGAKSPLTPIGSRTGNLAARSGALSPRRQAPVCSDGWRNGDHYTEALSCGAGLAAPAAGVSCLHAADHSRQTVDRAPRQRAGSGMSECGDERAASRGAHSGR